MFPGVQNANNRYTWETTLRISLSKTRASSVRKRHAAAPSHVQVMFVEFGIELGAKVRENKHLTSIVGGELIYSSNC